MRCDATGWTHVLPVQSATNLLPPLLLTTKNTGELGGGVLVPTTKRFTNQTIALSRQKRIAAIVRSFVRSLCGWKSTCTCTVCEIPIGPCCESRRFIHSFTGRESVIDIDIDIDIEIDIEIGMQKWKWKWKWHGQ